MVSSEKHKGGASGPAARRNRTVVLSCLAALAFMGALTYASVPLYRLFCQVTGFGGTTQRAEKAPGDVLDRRVSVRFDTNVAPGLGWKFEPVQRTMTVRVGEETLAYFRATNTSNKALSGTATFNVAPDVAGAYFSKIECFCFKAQTLAPGQSVEMPVSFFVDRAFASDRETAWVEEITLSYTFYPVDKPSAAAIEAQSTGARGG
jgi:cytochrome c oxidase assembly protein subunit 11